MYIVKVQIDDDVIVRWYVVGVIVDSISYANDPMLLLVDNSDSPSIVEQ